jgi:hypothetical protein
MFVIERKQLTFLRAECLSSTKWEKPKYLLNLWISWCVNVSYVGLGPLPRLHFLGTFAKLQEAAISLVMCLRLSISTKLPPTRRIFLKFDLWAFFENLLKNFKFYQNLTIIMCALHEYLCTFIIGTCWIFLEIRNIWDKSCWENQNTSSMINNVYFRKSCCFWDTVEKYGTVGDVTDGSNIWNMRIKCWINEAINTRSE